MTELLITCLALLAGLAIGAGLCTWRTTKTRQELIRTGDRQKVEQEQLARRLTEQKQALEAQTAQLSALQTTHAQATQTIAAQEAKLSRLNQLEQQEQNLRQELSQVTSERAELKTALTKERQHHQDKLDQLEKARADMSQQFENLAGRILEEKGKKFQEQNKTSLEHLLNPLKDNLTAFRKKVEETYDKETQDRVRLRTEIEALAKSNQTISAEATNLAQALKGQNQAQGAWGEMILEKVLESSGLEKGREYETQFSAKNAEGKNARPDVVVHLPNARDIIIDSKVSLNAYECYQNAETETERADALKNHITSLDGHIRNLSKKDYQNIENVRSLDYVLLFIPIEGAYSLAVQQRPGLMERALGEKIIIVTPTTLLLALRTVENIWRYERQNKNAEDIAKRAAALYDKFVGFTDDLTRIQKALTTAQEATNDATNKLTTGRGNLVSRIEWFRNNGGITPKKSLPLRDREDEETKEQK